MTNLSVIKAINDAFDKIDSTEIVVENVMFVSKATFFAIQEKNYFVIGTRIVTNPCVFFHKRKYKKYINEMFDLFQQTNVDSYPAFKTRNAAQRAVAYNRKHSWLTEKQEKEVEINGIKTICIKSTKFEETIESGEK